jgi:hypothetical protein
MTRTHHAIPAALRRFALVAAACGACASLWAQARPETGLLLDARTWQEEVVSASTGAWPADGWYRIQQRERQVEVRAVRTSDRDPDAAAADALYFRLPGTSLKTGLRAAYRHPAILQQPAIGKDYELALGTARFGLRVDQGTQGTQYVIRYGGQTYSYLLGAPDAHTGVRAVADLDGDQQPDFLVEVDDATFLLLSTRARPGHNVPTAELAGGC